MNVNAINSVGVNNAKASFKGYAHFNEHAINTDQVVRIWSDPQDEDKVKIATTAGTLNLKDKAKSKNKGVSFVDRVTDAIDKAAGSKTRHVTYKHACTGAWYYYGNVANSYDKNDIYEKSHTDGYKEV